MDDWIQISIDADLDAPEFLGLLDDRFLAGGWQEEGRLHLYWRRDQWNPHTMEIIARLVGPLIRAGSGRINLTAIPDQDWNRAWCDSVTPIRIGRRVVIRPSWHHADVGPGDIVLVLDPKQAFGTGHHATTQMMLEWLQEYVRGGERVLDVGTGSGILAMAALRLGAASAVGLDIDAVAIECAQAYAQDNGFGDELTLLTASLLELAPSTFDLVLANLDCRTLQQLQSELSARLSATGRLIVSGVLSEDGDDVSQGFLRAGLTLHHEHERQGWLALHFTGSSRERV
jgi:ribosomal protein L11 methyltransferase